MGVVLHLSNYELKGCWRRRWFGDRKDAFPKIPDNNAYVAWTPGLLYVYLIRGSLPSFCRSRLSIDC